MLPPGAFKVELCGRHYVDSAGHYLSIVPKRATAGLVEKDRKSREGGMENCVDCGKAGIVVVEEEQEEQQDALME